MSELQIELGLDRLTGVALATATVREEGFRPVEELLLPLADRHGMDLVRLGELGVGGPGLRGGLQGDLGRKRGRM
ncbi:hypothetical protein [Tautonia sociabilis]|uniref:hypothetical protein n=1 Tax=Tautonia sociabilis TaxID=2080755 RepID=UPI001315948D|nr:hypothetical protein [Tautonia sociabilis]